MNKKNGFTLVELLGVIVVLAILALITIPIISNVIDNVRIKSLQNSAYGLIEASNLYYISKGNNTTVRFDKTQDKDTLKELSYKGVVKIGTVIIDKKGKITVCITDGKNSAYKNYNETKVTTSKGKICNIKDGSSIVYLDDEATINEYDNSKLTELVNELRADVADLKEENTTLKTNLNEANTKISELESSNDALQTSLDSKASISQLNSEVSTLNATITSGNTNLQNQINAITTRHDASSDIKVTYFKSAWSSLDNTKTPTGTFYSVGGPISFAMYTKFTNDNTNYYGTAYLSSYFSNKPIFCQISANNFTCSYLQY